MDLFKIKSFKFFIFFALGLLIFLQGIFMLPVLDRDEARFATATKNMLETGDFIDIELEGVKRYKKPIGIYWAQSLTTNLLGSEPYDKIWTYRIPSLLGVMLSILLVFFSTKNIYGSNIASTAIVLLSCSFLLITEIHQAKSDGLLFLCINVCNFILLHALKNKGKNIKLNKILLFWIFLAFGTLIKGPIIFIYSILPVIVFTLVKGNNELKIFFKNYLGYLVYFSIVLPWFILITIKSDWFFWKESLGHDLFKKVVSSQESHGFFPGYYFISFYLFFWPGCIYIIPVIRSFYYKIKKFEINHENLFLVCIIVPGYLVYELIPTKLPHYILPIYPALSILVAVFLNENSKNTQILFKPIYLPLFLVFPLSIVSLHTYAINEFSFFDLYFFTLIFVFAVIILFCLNFFKRKKLKEFLMFALLFQTLNYFSIIYYLNPNLEKLWIAKNISNYSDLYKNYEIYHYGFNEPSLVFMMGHKSKRKSINDVKDIIKSKKEFLFFVSGDESEKFIEFSKDKENFKFVESFIGYNYSQGKYISTSVFKSYGSH